MPIYEYACSHCGQVTDILQKISDPALTHCPSCGADGLRKLVSAPSFRLKGSGWYETDFKKDKRRHLAEGDARADAEGNSKRGHTLDGGGEAKGGHEHKHDHGHQHDHGHKHDPAPKQDVAPKQDAAPKKEHGHKHDHGHGHSHGHSHGHGHKHDH